MKSTSKTYILREKLLILGPLFLSLLHQLAIPIGSDAQSTYNPIDNIALDCGSLRNGTAQDGRIWIGDTNSDLFTLNQNNSSRTSTALQSPQSGTDKVPHLTARLSFAQFTYIFSVTSGQKFIRLYFYLTSYPKFESSRALFSVKAGHFTLLNNFTASSDDGQDTMSKEFCVNVEEGERLNISFIPSSAIPGAFAFINGIEVVSMPTNLYYTAAYTQSPKMIGSDSLFPITNITAMETVYRVNVGGPNIPPQNDTGMFRSWSADNEYLTVAKPSSLTFDETGDKLSFTKMDNNYTAPALVYKTARSMGPNKTINENYYLTWTFLVDSGFIYLVRLHFCEFWENITKVGDMAFEIKIDNQIAENHFDIFALNEAILVPIYRDYAVVMGNTKEGEKKQNLSIQLHPKEEWQTLFVDAILNGVEIFKTSKDGDLAGSNSSLPSAKPPLVAPPSLQSTKNNQTAMFAIIGGVIFAFLVLSLLFFLLFQWRLRVKDSGSSDGASCWDLLVSSTAKPSKTWKSSLPSDRCHNFSLAEIKAATNNFDSVLIIGVGGFGNVYKGFINDGATTVAIKRLNPGSKQGAHEFKTEIEMLSQLRHLHLVSLIGYCNEDHEMILVYDYMVRGTLRDHLYNSDNPPLSLNQRLQICIGAARGLQYLHSGANKSIIHRDVKTTNILLDEQWVAKVSDFGLSKIGPNTMSKAHVSTEVKGSLGYLDPEYYRLQQLTEKSDVYSFGVVLCEVLCAKPPVNRLAGENPASLAEWIRKCYHSGTLSEIIDPHLSGKIAPECLKKFAEVAVSCLRENGIERPSTGDVVWGLEFALQLQESAEENIMLGRAQTETVIGVKSPLKESSVADSEDLFSTNSELAIGSRIGGMTITSNFSDEQSLLSNNSEIMMSRAVFSGIKNPQGR